MVQAVHKVVLLPCEIAGFFSGLQFGLEKLGIRCDVILTHKHPSGYQLLAIENAWARRLEAFHFLLNQPSTSRMSTIILSLKIILNGVMGTFYVVRNYDTVVCNLGLSLIPMRLDMIIYRLFGLNVISVIGHGSESRPPEMNCLGDERVFDEDFVKTLARKRRNMKINLFLIEQFSNSIFCSPQSGHYLKKEFLNLIELGIPMSINLLKALDAFPKQSGIRSRETLQIVHAPSSMDRKGSQIIYNVIERLKIEGYKIDFRVLTGMQNHEILSAIPQFDIAIDQLWSDIPMPVFAMECSAMGLPVIVCGYGWDHLNQFWSKDNWPPTSKGSPEELESKLRELMDDPQQRIDTARLQKEYVLRHRKPETVARNFLDWIQSPHTRTLDPSRISYEFGGASSLDAVTNLKQAMHRYEVKSGRFRGKIVARIRQP